MEVKPEPQELSGVTPIEPTLHLEPGAVLEPLIVPLPEPSPEPKVPSRTRCEVIRPSDTSFVKSTTRCVRFGWWVWNREWQAEVPKQLHHAMKKEP